MRPRIQSKGEMKKNMEELKDWIGEPNMVEYWYPIFSETRYMFGIYLETKYDIAGSIESNISNIIRDYQVPNKPQEEVEAMKDMFREFERDSVIEYSNLLHSYKKTSPASLKAKDTVSKALKKVDIDSKEAFKTYFHKLRKSGELEEEEGEEYAKKRRKKKLSTRNEKTKRC